jgi:hypothetical protein
MVRTLRLFISIFASFAAVLLSPFASRAEEIPSEVVSELCLYSSPSGSLVQVNGRDKVPEKLRAEARCIKQTAKPAARMGSPEEHFSRIPAPQKEAAKKAGGTAKQGGGLAAPQDIELEGSIRRAEINSALGPIELRWPRSVERLFGRTPERAMAEAALAVSRALKQGNFPPQLQKLRLSWQVVFMDGEPPSGQVPATLVNRCHPGWMTPPSNIYVVAQRVVGKCQGKAAASSVADADLTQLLVHEIGHAVEYYILKGRGQREPMRAEGFASWFESYASDFSGLIPKGLVERQHKQIAAEAMSARPGSWQFQYSGADYARSSMYFHGIVDRYGLSGLLRVYGAISKENGAFLPSAQKELVARPVDLELLAAKAAGLR